MADDIPIEIIVSQCMIAMMVRIDDVLNISMPSYFPPPFKCFITSDHVQGQGGRYADMGGCVWLHISASVWTRQWVSHVIGSKSRLNRWHSVRCAWDSLRWASPAPWSAPFTDCPPDTIFLIIGPASVLNGFSVKCDGYDTDKISEIQQYWMEYFSGRDKTTQSPI